MRNNEPTSAEPRFQHITATVKASGVKLTAQRLEIFRELAATADHPDAETLFRAVQARLPTVSLDTVYRTLWMLHDLGLVSTLGPRRDTLRFDANLEPHHHYVCVQCGLVRDFTHAGLHDLPVPDEVRRLGLVVGAHVEVRGVCQACLSSDPTPDPPGGRP